MAVSFGEQLRLAREARGISLKEISEQTRISTQYLEAIEKDQYKKLPGGIFNRSFIKAYARSVGFDETEAVEAYKRIAREQEGVDDEVQVTPQKFQVLSYDNTRSPLVTALLTGIVLLILSLGIYAGLHWYMKQADSTPTNTKPTTPQNSSTTPPQENTATTTGNETNNTSTTPVDPNAFIVQIKAKETVWVRTYNDDDKTSSYMAVMQPEAIQELTPQQQIKIAVAKEQTSSIEVTVNGRIITPPFQPEGKLAIAIITKDNYQQMLLQ